MRTTTKSGIGRLVLMTSHCAGMVDMVALPLWVGTLVATYLLDPQQAGGLVTLFLLGAVMASLLLAPRFNRIDGRLAATVGFAVASACFFASATLRRFELLALLHAVGGVAAGAGLSFTHGTIGRSANPHRLFGMAGMALGVFAVLLLGAAPQLMVRFGGAALFYALGVAMAIAALLAAWRFPVADAETQASRSFRESGAKLPSRVWFGIAGIGAMALVQAMVYSFLERMGSDRGFGTATLTALLVAIGFVNMFPSGLAAFLERRLNATIVLCAGPAIQGVLALMIALSHAVAPFAVAASVFVAVMLFTHTFAFGTLARMDVTGRVVAATPAMVMIGSAIGPVLGGTLAKLSGYEALGLAGAAFDVLALVCFWCLTRVPRSGDLELAPNETPGVSSS
ncbi:MULTISPECIES: MFS transporter [Roseateles]|uniref:MFS family arabinose efflux permease n=1 Tax=Pelomonas aquatica TaxID=431058 RepID=A0ABU1ZFS2_9BURK|nr:MULTISPECIES: MFS transporter [Roseateles]KQY81939.1 MFS transporter [Pelomonas sp. Root1444]MDR7299462.1 putative MFS family arabinose efflux permease [Pelomonas aquatica]